MPRKKTYREVFDENALELLGMVLTLLSIYIVKKLVEWLLGGELLWNWLPVRYCVDTVDFFVLVRFAWKVIRSFNE